MTLAYVSYYDITQLAQNVLEALCWSNFVQQYFSVLQNYSSVVQRYPNQRGSPYKCYFSYNYSIANDSSIY